jgi:hypothetical protein
MNDDSVLHSELRLSVTRQVRFDWSTVLAFLGVFLIVLAVVLSLLGR